MMLGFILITIKINYHKYMMNSLAYTYIIHFALTFVNITFIVKNKSTKMRK